LQFASTAGEQFSIVCRHILYPIKIAALKAPKEGQHFREMKRTRPAPAEDHRLPASFIHHPVALESARNRDRFGQP
jgi:hypothetical protein